MQRSYDPRGFGGEVGRHSYESIYGLKESSSSKVMIQVLFHGERSRRSNGHHCLGRFVATYLNDEGVLSTLCLKSIAICRSARAFREAPGQHFVVMTIEGLLEDS